MSNSLLNENISDKSILFIFGIQVTLLLIGANPDQSVMQMRNSINTYVMREKIIFIPGPIIHTLLF